MMTIATTITMASSFHPMPGTGLTSPHLLTSPLLGPTVSGFREGDGPYRCSRPNCTTMTNAAELAFPNTPAPPTVGAGKGWRHEAVTPPGERSLGAPGALHQPPPLVTSLWGGSGPRPSHVLSPPAAARTHPTPRLGVSVRSSQPERSLRFPGINRDASTLGLFAAGPKSGAPRS